MSSPPSTMPGIPTTTSRCAPAPLALGRAPICGSTEETSRRLAGRRENNPRGPGPLGMAGKALELTGEDANLPICR